MARADRADRGESDRSGMSRAPSGITVFGARTCEDTAITTSRLLCYYALSMIDQGQATEGHAAMAKRYAQNACQDAVWQAMNLFGAMGLATEGRIEALYRDMRMIAIPDGTNEILALIHGRDLTGMEAFRGLVARNSGQGD